MKSYGSVAPPSRGGDGHGDSDGDGDGKLMELGRADHAEDVTPLLATEDNTRGAAMKTRARAAKLQVHHLPVENVMTPPRTPSMMPAAVLSSWTSWWSVLFFSWCEYLASLCAERPLKMDDIWALDETSASLYCVQQYKASVVHKGCLVRGFMTLQARVLLTSGLLTFGSVVCELVTPIAVYNVVDAAASGGMDAIISKGTMWTVVLLVSRFLRSFLLAWGDFILNYAKVRTVGPLNLILLECVLSGWRIQQGSSKDIDQATNLFSNDVHTFGRMIESFHRFWSLLLELVGLFGLLYWLIGGYMGSILIASLVIYFCIQLLTVKETLLLRQRLDLSDIHFGALRGIFDNILGVKLQAWQDRVIEHMERIRLEEKPTIRKHLLVRTLRITLTWVAPSLNLIVTGMILASFSNQALNSSALTFTAVAIFHAINDSFAGLLRALQTKLEFNVSIGRLATVIPIVCRGEQVHPSCGKNMAVAAHSAPSSSTTAHVDSDLNIATLSNASFADGNAPAETPDLLHFVNLRVRRGEFIVVHGRVGSGKSVLLSALADTLLRTRGHMSVNGTVAYCSQSPWIQSTTVRENVLFGRVFDATRYWSVLAACELLHDLKALPSGDMTMVGSRSYVSLSSGQQSRIALARACYADADMYILDSPLDSVDSVVQTEILINCFGKLLQNKAIVLATHNPEVTHSEYVDRTILMENMDVQPSSHIDSGREGKSTTFVSRRRKLIADVDVWGSARRRKQMTANQVTPKPEGMGRVGLQLNTSILLSPVVHEVQALAKNPCLIRNRSVNRYRDMGCKSVIKEYFSYSRNPWKVFLVVLYHFITQVLATSSIYMFSRWMSVYGDLRYRQHMSSEDAFEGSSSVFHVYVALVAASCVLFLMSAGVTFYFTIYVSDRLFRAMTMALLHSRMAFFAETTVGSILNRYCKDLKAVDSSLHDAVFALLKTFFACYCGLFASLGWMSGHMLKASTVGVDDEPVSQLEAIGLAPMTSWSFWILLMALNLMLTTVIMGWFWYMGIQSNKPGNELFMMHREAVAPIFTFAAESIAGRRVISAFGVEQRDRMTEQFAAKIDHVSRVTWAIWSFEAWLTIRSLLIENLITGVLLTGLICFGHDADPYRPATIGLLLFLLLNMRDDMKNTFLNWNLLEKNLVCLQRVLEYVHVEAELPSNPELPSLTDPMWPRNGRVAFINVDFQYENYIPPGLHESLPPTHQRNHPHPHMILKNVSFSVQSGAKVGIIGRSGAGKSSLAMAILRVNNPSHGMIQIDGVDVTRVNLNVLRAKVSYLPPDPVFSVGTLRDYLDPAGQANDFELWSTLEKTGLKASIRRLNFQLEAPLTNIVTSWSNGERQLLCLARALLLRARVIFLDEATTATDQETDFNVQRVVCESLDVDTTLLCISHRIDSVLGFDKLLVMADGHVAGFGSVSDLVASGEGEFLDLLESAQLVY